MPYKIIAGPVAMYVTRHNVRSVDASIGETTDLHEVGKALYQTIRRVVEWNVWLRHRLAMVHVRRRVDAARISPTGIRGHAIARHMRMVRRSEWWLL